MTCRFRFACASMVVLAVATTAFGQALPGTKLLKEKTDFAEKMVDGIDKYLLRKIAAAKTERQQYWKRDFSSARAYNKSVEPNRERLKRWIGVKDKRVSPIKLEYVATFEQPSLIAKTARYEVHAVRWSVLPGVDAEGLLIEPADKPIACVVVAPDADWPPEMLIGIGPKKCDKKFQFARLLAEQGCRVLVPTLIDRKDTWSNNPAIGRYTNQTHREWIYRMAFMMGRHIIGYEVQRVLAAVDWFAQQKDHPPIGVVGYSEGGLIALYAAAVDPRIKATVVAGYFGPREKCWEEPLYRNVWGLLREFGDAEIASLVAPRVLILVPCKVPEVSGPPKADGKKRSCAAPGKVATVPRHEVIKEVNRARQLAYKPLGPIANGISVLEIDGEPKSHWLGSFLSTLVGKYENRPTAAPPSDRRKNVDITARQKRQFQQLVDFTQGLLPTAEKRREEFFWSKTDKASVKGLKKTNKKMREVFWNDLIGKLPKSKMALNPRTRLIYETPKWKGYEVVLDVYDDVISFGILLVPNDIKPGEKRPVVVCQHGLEGRPKDVVNPKEDTRAYHSFGAKLADRGFVVFAPQNPYIFKNRFRQVARKANLMKLTLYSLIVRQHERILEWLATLPFVDADRIAYYGLSYGGKVAMRIPSILEGYCLSICSGDFNEWVWKNMTLLWSNSYMFTGEYEMFEFNLGNTFNYAEMAALIAPRPFMVERGHRDGVGLDEYVAFEYAKVRRFYDELGIGDRTEIEWFNGRHEINSKGTFEFLHKHLGFESRK